MCPLIYFNALSTNRNIDETAEKRRNTKWKKGKIERKKLHQYNKLDTYHIYVLDDDDRYILLL